MRWDIIRLIFVRELRDQLRDRRTLFMIAVLPLLLYPVLGIAAVQLAFLLAERPSRIGIVGTEALPPPVGPLTIAATIGRLAAPGSWLDIGVSVPVLAIATQERLEYQPLLDATGFAPALFAVPWHSQRMQVVLLTRDEEESALDSRQVDLVLRIAPEFATELERGGRPEVYLNHRDGDERATQALERVRGVLESWRKELRAVRLARRNIPTGYDDPFEVRDPEQERTAQANAANQLLTGLDRLVPFMLTIWALYGALFPAVDLCAGEKERGTMETVLLSPASRPEIVWGKFLVVWLFSAWTAILNELSLILCFWQICRQIGVPFAPSLSLLWTVPLTLPLSAFVAAIALALGAYARSTREGQYYLVPLVLITLPTSFVALAPGVELNSLWCLVPITGLTLFLQELTKGDLAQIHWLGGMAALATGVVYNALALRWAIAQFQREDILFREAERIDLGLWLRQLVRDKRSLPGPGMALLCFIGSISLYWLNGLTPSLDTSSIVLRAVSILFPAVGLAFLLTRQPLAALGLRWPVWWTLPVAVLLALALALPLAELDRVSLHRLLPDAEQTLTGQVPFSSSLPLMVLGLVFLPAVAREVTYRGFILTGLREGAGAWSALLLSAGFYALALLQPVQFGSGIILGIVLGVLALRSGSVVPGLLFHVVQALVLLCLVPLAGLDLPQADAGLRSGVRGALLLLGSIGAAGLVILLAWDPLLRRGSWSLNKDQGKPW